MSYGNVEMMAGLYIDPIAVKKAVYWRPSTAATVAKVGQPVAYNSDLAGDYQERSTNPVSTDVGGVAYAEGAQNYNARLLVVEEIKDTDYDAYAGVIAELGSLAGADGDLIQIYVPNNAIVPVWTDKSITIKDKLFLESGEQTFVNATQAGMGPAVAIAYETIDRSSTAGLVWAKLHSKMEDVVYPGTLGIAPSEVLWQDCPWDEIARNPGMGISFFDDFMGSANLVTAEGWVITQTTTGTLSLVSAEGGELKLDTAGNTSADDGLEAQLVNCAVLPAAGKTIWFEARVKVSDATDQWYVGLAAVDTTIIPSGVIDDVSDKCGFWHAVSEANDKVSTITARADADDATSDVADVTDGAYMTVGFKITGLTSVEFYVDGVLVETGATAANIPNALMCLTLASKVEVSGADQELSIDWVKLAQLGARA